MIVLNVEVKHLYGGGFRFNVRIQHSTGEIEEVFLEKDEACDILRSVLQEEGELVERTPSQKARRIRLKR